MNSLRPLLHPIVWLLVAISAVAVTLVFLAGFALPSYALEEWLTVTLSARVATLVLDGAFYGGIVLIWAAGGCIAGHLSTSLGLWRARSSSGYWWGLLAAVAVAGGIVAIVSAPIAAAGVLLGAYLGRRTGDWSAARDTAMRSDILDEVFDGQRR